MKASGSTAKGMAKALRLGQMELNTQVIGRSTRRRAKENSLMLTEICMMGNGAMTRLMGMESIFIRMEPSTKDFGKMTCSMA